MLERYAKEPIKKNNLLELEKDFIELKDRKLKERYKSYFFNQLSCMQMKWMSLNKKK